MYCIVTDLNKDNKNLLSGLFLFLSIIYNVNAHSQSASEIDSLKAALKNEKGNQAKVEHLFLLNDKLVSIHDFKQARQYLDSALLLSKRLNYKRGVAKYYNGMGTLLNIEGNYPEALSDYSVSLNMGMKIGDSLLVARVSLNIGKLYNKLGKFDEAMNYLNQALRISKRIGDKDIQKAAYDKLSVAYIFQGNYPEAIRCIENAIKLAEEAGNTSEAKKSSLNLGIIYKYQGNFVKALEVFLKAVPYFEETEDKDMLISLDNCIGGIYLHQKDYTEALKYLNNALEFSRDQKMKPDEASNLSSIGLVYHGLGQYAEAINYELQALKIYTEIDDKEGIAETCLIIGETYDVKGDMEKALESFYKSLKVCNENNYNLNKASCLIAIGNIMIKQATHADPAESVLKYEKARDYLMESLDLSMIMDQKDHLMNIYKSLYRIDSAKGNFKKALENFKLYALYKDSLYNIETSNQMASLEVQFIRDQKNKEITLLTKENEIKSNEIKWQKMQRNGILFTIGLILLVGFLVIRSRRLKKKLEKEQAVAKERERISADLHDDIGSGLSKIILMLEVLNREAESQEAKEKTRAVSEESLELSKNMSEVIWALNSRHDSLESLSAYIRKYAGSYFENSDIRFNMKAPAHVPQTFLSSEKRRNIFYVVKEALHNIVKHARATEAEIILTINDGILSITIRDNGIGMHDGELNRFGNGMIQMRDRLQSIGGEFSIGSSNGTWIKLSLPV